jgi:cyclopropane fatty-acyl-phospholipid synthase-like methyltransferase
MDRHILFGFTNVDQTADPDYFIRFLDTASSQESFQGYKRRSFSLLEIKSGRHILELGGGTGDDARALAAMAGWDATSPRCFRKQVYSMYAPIPRPCVSRTH